MANQRRRQLNVLIVATAVIVARAMIVVRVTTTILAIKVRTIATVSLVDKLVGRAMIVMTAMLLKAKDVIVVVAVVARADAMKARRAKIAKAQLSAPGTVTAATLRKVANSFHKKR